MLEANIGTGGRGQGAAASTVGQKFSSIGQLVLKKSLLSRKYLQLNMAGQQLIQAATDQLFRQTVCNPPIIKALL